MTRVKTVAAGMLIALFSYYEGYRWIPLGRWNGQFHWPVQNDQFYPDIVIGALLLLFACSFLRQWKIGMWSSVALLGLWLSVHMFDWWIPYANNSGRNYARYSFYASHTQILPVVQHHYPPDGGHAILDFLLFPTFLFALSSVVSTFTKHGRRMD